MPRQLDPTLSTGLSRALLAVAATACLLAGCSADGSGQSGTQPSAAGSDAATTTATASATPLPTPSQSPTPAPTRAPATTPTRAPATTPAFPAAADGTNLKACADSSCEVVVRTGTKIPVSRRVAGFSRLVVSAVDSSGVSFGGSTANASVSAGGQQPGTTFRLNDLNVSTVARQGGVAVLRLRPAR